MICRSSICRTCSVQPWLVSTALIQFSAVALLALISLLILLLLLLLPFIVLAAVIGMLCCSTLTHGSITVGTDPLTLQIVIVHIRGICVVYKWYS
jgi:type III secretory pathway component EscS